jgi:hypothetical protein
VGLVGRAEVARLHLLAAAGKDPLPAPRPLEHRPGLGVGLEEDLVVVDEADHEIPAVDPVPAEHGSSPHRPERSEQVDGEGDEGGGFGHGEPPLRVLVAL